MPRKCIIPSCRIQEDDPGCTQLHFRKFPKNDDQYRAWIEALNNQFGENLVNRMLSPKHIFLCDLHFTDECFYFTGKGEKLLLKRGCSPSIFINFKGIAPKAITEKYENIYNLLENNEKTCTDIKLLPVVNRQNMNDDYVHQVDKYSQINEDAVLMNSQNDSIKIEIEDNSLNISNTANENPLPSNQTKNKSFGDIDLEFVDFTNISEIKKLFKKAQAEVLSQRRTIQKQRKVIKLLRNQLYRSKIKVKNIKSLISHIKEHNFISEEVSGIIEETLPDAARQLVQRLLYKRGTKKPFPDDLKEFATTLQFYSPKCYNYVRSKFLNILPHPVTVQKWHKAIECVPDTNASSIIEIKTEIE